MATILASGESVEVIMALGFPTRYFTLNDPDLGQLDSGGYLDGTLLGDDVAPYVQDLTINRGRSDQLSSFQAGTASITLINNDRRFDPINQSSPYYDVSAGRSGIQPRRAVSVTLEGETVFTGRITDIDVQYDIGSAGTSNVTISAADDFVTLATLATDAESPVAELSGARVNFVLDLPEVGWSATARDIDAGTAALGDYAIAANTNVLTYLQQVEKAEQGFLFMGRSGDLTFTDRAGASFVTPVAYFDDNGTNLPYSAISTIAGQEFFYNRITATRQGGASQAADDAGSQTEFGILTLALTDLLLETDAEAQALADDLLSRYAEPSYRFDLISIDVHTLNSTDRATVDGLELADVINVTRNFVTGTPASISLDFSVDRLRHRVTPSTHTVEIGLAYVQVLYPFVLNDATYGVLDASNALT